MILKGKIIDIHNRRIFNGQIDVNHGVITSITELDKEQSGYIMPGFIDSHVHIESSMLTPGSFAEVAVRHGTVGVVCDPHEIANVMGKAGIDFMIDNSKTVPLNFYFGVPSCVPATSFESNGAVIGVEETIELLKREEVKCLAEMMNFPGVLSGDSDVTGKIEAAKRAGKPVDGHAPGLSGSDLSLYIGAGIVTDHEATSIEEAEEKIGKGMKILIREGSAARNLEDLHPLIAKYPCDVMLCCDDIHPEMLIKRHINSMVKYLLERGYNLFDVIAAASMNAVNHYRLETGLLRVGDRADFIIVDDPVKLNIRSTWINGEMVFDGVNTLFKTTPVVPVNNFRSSKIDSAAIKVAIKGDRIRVIEAFDGELNTGEMVVKAKGSSEICSDTDNDILKIVVKERYLDNPPMVGFIKGFGLKSGAFASSVAHDSHNIIAVGTDDHSIAEAINRVIEMKGGLALHNNGTTESLQLNIGGIMADVPCGTIASGYEELSERVKEMGCPLQAPFMTLSFMGLLVIPDLKIGDRGLFKLNTFSFVDLFV